MKNKKLNIKKNQIQKMQKNKKNNKNNKKQIIII